MGGFGGSLGCSLGRSLSGISGGMGSSVDE